VTFIVSFLLVSRVAIAQRNYMTARRALSDMCREVRHGVQNACVFSYSCTDVPSKEWRHEMAYRSMIFLRTAMAVIDFPSTKLPSWEVSDLEGKER